MSNSPIKLLTFDLDDTLWDVGAVVRRADREMMNWLALHYPQLVAQFDQAGFFALRREVHAANPDIRHDLGALRLRTLELALHRSGHDLATAQRGARDAFAVFFRWRNTVEFFPDVMTSLQALRPLYPLYALSNGGADIAHMGLGHIFSLHLSAASVGAAKPDPAMYRQALQHAGLEPAQAIHIGDHPQEDIAAAQQLGMKTIWVNRQGKDWPLEQRADAEVSDFTNLPALIRQLAGD
jgi:putative hydrolase of the HAD superfamily